MQLFPFLHCVWVGVWMADVGDVASEASWTTGQLGDLEFFFSPWFNPFICSNNNNNKKKTNKIIVHSPFTLNTYVISSTAVSAAKVMLNWGVKVMRSFWNACLFCFIFGLFSFLVHLLLSCLWEESRYSNELEVWPLTLGNCWDTAYLPNCVGTLPGLFFFSFKALESS